MEVNQDTFLKCLSRPYDHFEQVSRFTSSVREKEVFIVKQKDDMDSTDCPYTQNTMSQTIYRQYVIWYSEVSLFKSKVRDTKE